MQANDNRKDLLINLFSLHKWRQLKDKFFQNKSFEKIALKLFALGLRANHITIFNAFLGFVSLYFLFTNLALYVLFFLINGIIDAVDGVFARYTKSSSRLGDQLDHGFDILLPFLALIKSYFVFGYWWIIVIIVLFVVETIYLVAGGHIERKIPTKMSMFFFVFGLYDLGLVVHGVYQSVTFALYVLKYSQLAKLSPPDNYS